MISLLLLIELQIAFSLLIELALQEALPVSCSIKRMTQLDVSVKRLAVDGFSYELAGRCAVLTRRISVIESIQSLYVHFFDFSIRP